MNESYIYIYTYETSLNADKEDWGGNLVLAIEFTNPTNDRISHRFIACMKMESHGSTWLKINKHKLA